MSRIIGVTELQCNFRTFYDDVVRKRIPLVLTRGLGPEAVLMSYDDYLHYQHMQEIEVLGSFDKVWSRLAQVNATVGDDVLAADIKGARG
jgi:PHD/YefM family antitoxin component YafN of YafNO toxin-antitoxin module